MPRWPQLVLLAGLVGAAAPPTPEAQLAEIRAEAMRAAPSPAQLARIGPVLKLSESFRAAGQPAQAGAALNVAVIYALLGGDLKRAIAIADRAAALCGAASDKRCYGSAMNQSAIALWRLNDPYAAMQRLDRGARAFREIGDIERAAIARLNSANIRYDIGDLSGALADYDEIDRVYGDDRSWDPVGMLNSKAEVLVKLGRLDEARRTADRAVAMLRQRPRSKGTRWESDVVNATRGTMALVEASAGSAAAALPLYQAFIASADRSGSPFERYNASHAYAEGLMKLNRPAAAYPYIRTALSLVDQADPADRRDTYDLASLIAAATGRTTEALNHLRAAEAVRVELAAATLRSAINDANAQMAVAEREAQLARRDAAWAAQRTRLFGWMAAAVLGIILIAFALLGRARVQATERRYAAVLDERTRMARELHDTLLQGFTGITMQLHAASKTDPAKLGTVLGRMADESGRWLTEARHAVWDMRPAAAGTDLRTGLEQAVAAARLQSDAAIDLDYSLETMPDATATTALLRVAQEAISNAARHARAARIDVAARGEGGRVTLSVRDDGIGFIAAPGLSALGGHWGLLGMRERIEALGGMLRVDTTPGQGTLVTAELPR